MDDPGPSIFSKFSKLFKSGEDPVTEEEILSMVDAGGETGVIEHEQREMINNIFEFDDFCVSDLMTHRTDVAAIERNSVISDLRNLAIEEGYSRIPVYEQDLDNIVGIAYIKDMLKYIDGKVPPNLTVGDIMRKAFYVPESMNCSVLFKRMIESHVQMAIVVDEYGGTAGIITLEDLIESIVGNIQDEFDDEEEEIQKIDENIFTVDGTTDIDEVEDLLSIKIPEGDYDTIGGFIISLIGYIPEDNTVTQVDYESLHLTAFNVEDRRIGRVRIEKLSSENARKDIPVDDE